MGREVVERGGGRGRAAQAQGRHKGRLPLWSEGKKMTDKH
jgi:hypothetical protein